MEIVGYNKEYVFTDHLNEATITCTYDELKNIVSFLDEVVKKVIMKNQIVVFI